MVVGMLSQFIIRKSRSATDKLICNVTWLWNPVHRITNFMWLMLMLDNGNNELTIKNNYNSIIKIIQGAE